MTLSHTLGNGRSANTERAVQVATDLRSGRLARVRHDFRTSAAYTTLARSSTAAEVGTKWWGLRSPGSTAQRRVCVPLFTLRRPMRVRSPVRDTGRTACGCVGMMCAHSQASVPQLPALQLSELSPPRVLKAPQQPSA